MRGPSGCKSCFILVFMLMTINFNCYVIGFSEIVPKIVYTKFAHNMTFWDKLLDFITEVTENKHCLTGDIIRVVPVPIRTQRYDVVRQKADLVTRFVRDYGTKEAMPFIQTLLKIIVQSDAQVYGSEMSIEIHNDTNTNSGSGSGTGSVESTSINGGVVNNNHGVFPYNALAYRQYDRSANTSKIIFENGHERFRRPHNISDFMSHVTNGSFLGNWTYPYYSCKYRRWIITYCVPMDDEQLSTSEPVDRSTHTFDVDIDVSRLDINQCDPDVAMDQQQQPDGGSIDDGSSGYRESDYPEIPVSQIASFRGTHKCDPNTSKCIFKPGGGWIKGGYVCRCKDGYFSAAKIPVFNGSSVEIAWKDKTTNSYSVLYVCKQCAPGCDTCFDESPCLAEYNWPFRISLLTISVICIMLTILLMSYVYSYRRLKVIKVASPIFLVITLVGAVIMYLEMGAIFPVLDMYSCVATKWTRHLGFCLTYSALLLKTWRVSLTYRVKSAHKIKLTDKQLLQWLFPILLVMVIYLSTWTVSSPPSGVWIKDYNGLKFKQCSFDWWDHSLAIGELLFLLWGIRVCYTVRNAESFFNEAKYISWAIYNITIVNVIMISIHIMIFPEAPPDLKYLFGFVRTQLSTTITTLLVFGPKFYRVIKGQGDIYDNRARARGVTASFSLNGIGLVHEEPTDLFQENEELKEEIQKLAAQIEFMKIVHMEMNNRHIKPKAGGYFTQTAAISTQSAVAKAIYMKFDSTDTPTSRISPAAELISERV